MTYRLLSYVGPNGPRGGLMIDETAVADIVAFLGALTGAVPANYAPPGLRPEL